MFVSGMLLRDGHGDNAVFGVFLFLANAAILPIMIVMSNADLNQRAQQEEEKRVLYEKLKKCEASDKRRFEQAWIGYKKHAEASGHPDAEERMCQVWTDSP